MVEALGLGRAAEHRAGEGLLVLLEPRVEHLALDAPVAPSRPLRPEARNPCPLGAAVREALRNRGIVVGLGVAALEIAPAKAAGDIEHQIVDDDAGPGAHRAEPLQGAGHAQAVKIDAGIGIGLEHVGVEAGPAVIDLNAEHGAIGLPVVAALNAADEAGLVGANVGALQIVGVFRRPGVPVAPGMIVVGPADVTADIEPAELRARRLVDRGRLAHRKIGRNRGTRGQRANRGGQKEQLLHNNPPVSSRPVCSAAPQSPIAA